MNRSSIRTTRKRNIQPRHFFVTAFLLALTSLIVPAKSLGTFGVSIENFGKVNDNYYRGAQPDEIGFSELKRLGIKTVIDLRKDSKSEASDWARSQGLQYINIPLTTKKAATEEQTAKFLQLVNDSNNWPVYVHCKGGRHRTGEMTAIYRITHDGWTADQAYQEMRKYDFESGLFGGPKSLKKYVFSYYEHFSANKQGQSVGN